MSPLRLLLVDIDHTLSDACWRDDMIDACYRDKNWDEYHRCSIDDLAVPEMIELINSLHSSGWHVVGLTTRPEKWRQLTITWLLKHGILLDQLLMRPNDDYRSNAESKLAIFREFTSDLAIDHVIVIDDHDGIVGAFRSANITVLQAHIRRTNVDVK